MKIHLLLFFLMQAALGQAQTDTTVTYYDRNGKPCPQGDDAVTFSLIVKQGDHYKKLMVDGADNRVQYIAYCTDADCKNFDGPYKSLHKNGKTNEAGNYVNNKKQGVWKSWYDDGRLADSSFYIDGNINGLGLEWDKDGRVSDSLIFQAGGKGESHGYWNNGNPSQRGSYNNGKKDGEWTYYYYSGVKCQEVKYKADSAISFICYDEQGNLQQSNCVYEQEASFPGGELRWIAYLQNKMGRVVYPDAYYKAKIHATVWVQFVIDAEGNITDTKVVEPVDPFLDRTAVDIIKHGPKWQHAIQFNRPVRAYRKQPITFLISD